MKLKNVILNSLLAFTGAYLSTILLHELAHFMMAIGLGQEATLYHNRVFTQFREEKNLHPILVASAGPIFSLVQGIVFLKLSKYLKTGLKSMFTLWMGIAGLISFFGYIMIAPIIKDGDTGFVFQQLGIAIWIQISAAILSIIAITLILMRTVKNFEQFVSLDKSKQIFDRIAWANALILFPLIIGIILISLLQLPVPHFASILATILAPMSIMAVYGTFLASKTKIEHPGPMTNISIKFSIPLLVIVLIIILANRLLVFGLHL